MFYAKFLSITKHISVQTNHISSPQYPHVTITLEGRGLEKNILS